MMGILNTDKHPIFPIKVIGYFAIVNAIIDTGCRDNILFPERFITRESFFKKTGNKIGMIQPGGQHIDADEIFQEIQIGKNKFSLTFAIMQGTFKDADIILGTKFLYENKMSLYIDRDIFILKKSSRINRILLAISDV